jgi:IS1 family transposase
MFAMLGISDMHSVAPGKSQTHLIEAVNSSIRDNLARFNRRSKRYSKSLEVLNDTLLLFFHQKQYKINIR